LLRLYDQLRWEIEDASLNRNNFHEIIPFPFSPSKTALRANALRRRELQNGHAFYTVRHIDQPVTHRDVAGAARRVEGGDSPGVDGIKNVKYLDTGRAIGNKGIPPVNIYLIRLSGRLKRGNELWTRRRNHAHDMKILCGRHIDIASVNIKPRRFAG
jgi:hypothetical protein